MPVSIKRSPFVATASVSKTTKSKPRKMPRRLLRTPQARCLAALQPDDVSDPISEWPLVTRAQLGVRAGYTAVSGTVTRALNGIHEDSSSGDAHPGLLRLGLVEEVILDVMGVSEVNYRATMAGVRAYQTYMITHGSALPQLRDAAICTNDRYKKSSSSS